MNYQQYDLEALMDGPLASLFCCIGDPVVGNPTQYMMEKAFEYLSLPYRYLTMNVEKEQLENAIKGLKALNFSGYNITSPHKINAIPFLDTLTPSAALSNAVNCVYQDGNTSTGDNTDGKGFITAVTEVKSIKGMKVLVFGSGGAARAIICELALHEASSITIVNRSVEKALQIKEDLKGKVETTIEVAPLTDGMKIDDSYDLIVQATSVGLFDEKGRLPLTWEKGDYSKCIASDVVFNPINTLFLQEALQMGCTCVDGLGMLVYQGAIAFEKWTGKKAPLEVMKNALIEAFSDKGI